MVLESLAAPTLAAFFITLVTIMLCAPLARAIGLVDAPSARKTHAGQIPVVGGVAIFASLALVGIFWGSDNASLVTVNGSEAFGVFISCGAFLVVTGVLDDRLQLGVFVRVLSEILVAVAVIEFLELRVAHLGDIFSVGNLRLDPSTSYAFTVVAIFGIINAFNMLDGMDGLLASLVIVTLALFHLVTSTEPRLVSLAVGASLLGFLISNLSLSPIVPKTFLGDAGSKLLGFVVVCLLLATASAQVGNAKIIKPVTALFIVSLPLYDMVFTTLRRIIQKGSPFAADRSHIHHLMQDLGFSDRRALVIILCVHSSVALVGLVLHRAATPEYFQFAIFLGCFALYCLLSSQLWLAAEKLQAAHRALSSGNVQGADSSTSVNAKREEHAKPLAGMTRNITPIKNK